MKYWIMTLMTFCLLLSCEMDDKDELEGKWLLKEVTDATGVTHPVDTVWYNIQNTLFMYQLYDASVGVEGKYLHLYGFKYRPDSRTVIFELTNDPSMVVDFLPHTDWTSGRRTFEIEQATGSRLVLTGDGKRYSFSKF